MVVSKEPIKKLKMKVKITGICTTDRYLDIGLLNQSRKDSATDLINKFGSAGNFSYCGYSKSGVDGTMLSNNCSSGFEVNTELIVNFDGNKLHIYTQDKRADLSKDLASGNYYLFFVLFHPEASCEIKTFASTD